MIMEVKNLSFGYDESAKILKDISFTLHGDGLFCILGQNGTGKSTLLKCLIGEEKPEGRVLLDGKDYHLFSEREAARRIAYLPQNHVPTFPFRVLDVVMMGRSARMRYFASPGSEEERIATDNLRFLGIEHLKDKPYTNISGGERQLVLIAAALTQQPEFLIMDEPTAHLDFGNTHRFLDLVLRLREGGIGILMTTHFPDQALYLNAQTLVLHDGRLGQAGRAEDVINEKTMSELYGLPVHLGRIGDRKVCIAGDI